MELRRAVARSPSRTDAAPVLDRVALIGIEPEAVEIAAGLDPPSLRALDAIHLASALLLRASLEAFVAYDERLLAAAASAGLAVASPS